MIVLVLILLVLLVTNLATAVLLVRHRRPEALPDDAVEVFEAPRPAGVSAPERRLFTIEVLNPLELASARAGRLGGLAGSLAPGLTRRLVHDQVFKTLRVELDRMSVRADVRLHTLRRVPNSARPATTTGNVVDAVVVDEVAPLDLKRDP